MFLPFNLIGQCREDRTQSGREKVMGSRKVHEPGLKLGMPEAQRCCMSVLMCNAVFDLIDIFIMYLIWYS